MARTLADQSGFGLIEVMVASSVAMIGLLSLAGLQLAVATQSRIAGWQTSQALAAQEVFEGMLDRGYTTAVSGSYTASVDGQVHQVMVNVTQTAPRVKQLQATVAAIGSVGPRGFLTRIHEVRPVPPPPASVPTP